MSYSLHYCRYKANLACALLHVYACACMHVCVCVCVCVCVSVSVLGRAGAVNSTFSKRLGLSQVQSREREANQVRRLEAKTC